MLSWDDVVAVKSDIVTRETDGELVVVMPEQGKFIVLNATGARILQLADGQCTLHTIATRIAEEFSIAIARVQEDVMTFAQSLFERKILFIV